MGDVGACYRTGLHCGTCVQRPALEQEPIALDPRTPAALEAML